MKNAIVALLLTGCGGAEELCGAGTPTYGNVCTQDGSPMRWPSFPVKITTVNEIDLDVTLWTTGGAQAMYDDLGVGLFTLADCEECPEVVVREASKLEAFHLKEKIPEHVTSIGRPVILAGTCFYSRGEILLLWPFRRLSDQQKIDVMKYELGHVLGLQHEPYWSGYDNLGCPMADVHRAVIDEQVRLAEEGS